MLVIDIFIVFAATVRRVGYICVLKGGNERGREGGREEGREGGREGGKKS